MEDEKLWSRAGTGGMGNTCAGLSGPIAHRSTWGAISRNGGNAALLTVAMGDCGSGTGSPRARAGCSDVPRAGVPHGQADF